MLSEMMRQEAIKEGKAKREEKEQYEWGTYVKILRNLLFL